MAIIDKGGKRGGTCHDVHKAASGRRGTEESAEKCRGKTGEVGHGPG